MNNQNKNTHRQNDQFIYGLHPVQEALKAGKEFDRILLQRDIRSEQTRELLALAREAHVQVQYVPIEKLNRLVRNNHQGVIGFVSLVSYQPLEDVLISAFEKGDTPLVLLLDQITDVRNLGAIARSAECSGVHAIIIPTQGSAQINADAIKTSAGALHTIPICKSENLKTTLHYLRQSGLTVVAASEHAKTNYFDADLTQSLAIIMGSEEKGVSPAYLKLCDNELRIPMQGVIGSLNVSVAAGVLLFETVRQRLRN